MSSNSNHDQNAQALQPSKTTPSDLQEPATQQQQYGQRLELNIFNILELLQKNYEVTTNEAIHQNGQPQGDIVSSIPPEEKIAAKPIEANVPKIDARQIPSLPQLQPLHVMNPGRQECDKKFVQNEQSKQTKGNGHIVKALPQVNINLADEPTQIPQFDQVQQTSEMGQKMTLIQSQIQNKQIMLQNQNNTSFQEKIVQMNQIPPKNNILNGNGQQQPQIIYEVQKSRTDTVYSNNSSCTNQKTQIMTLSSIPPNGHSNTVYPIGTSSNGFRTETVQSSLLEKAEKNVQLPDIRAQLGTELAKQLTEGKIDFSQFLNRFQALIPNLQNQKDISTNQNLTQPVSNNEQTEVRNIQGDVSQQLLNQYKMHQTENMVQTETKKPIAITETSDRKHTSHQPSGRNNGVIIEKMHNQMFFEDLFPQINSLHKKPNNQQFISDVVGRHNRSQRPMNYPGELSSCTGGVQLTQATTQANPMSINQVQTQSRRYFEQYQNQNQQGNKSKDSRQSKQSNKSNKSRQSRNSEGQHSSSLQRFQQQRPRKVFENDSQSHDEAVAGGEKKHVNVTTWKPQFKKSQEEAPMENSNDLQGIILSLLKQKINQLQQPDTNTSSGASYPQSKSNDLQEMILTQLREKAHMLRNDPVKNNCKKVCMNSELNDENTAQFAPSQKSNQNYQNWKNPVYDQQGPQLGMEKVAAIDLNNFPFLPQEIKNIIIQKQNQYNKVEQPSRLSNIAFGNQGSSTDNEDKSNGLDFKKLHDIIENYIPPKNEGDIWPPQISQNEQMFQRIRNQMGQLPVRYNGPTSTSSGEEKQQWQKYEMGQGLQSIQDQLKNFLGQQVLMNIVNQNNSVLGKRNLSERQGDNSALIEKIIEASKKQQNYEQENQVQEQAAFGENYDEYYTPMMIRLRNQVRKNQSKMQFRQIKNELMQAVKAEKDPSNILIEAKPKRAHHNMGTDDFRGSKFRGVSRNKNKWQMMIMINQKKVYVGAIHTENDAARYYDSIAIICQGLSAKTNFAYNSHKIRQILQEYDMHSESGQSYQEKEASANEDSFIKKHLLDKQQPNIVSNHEQIMKLATIQKLKNITPESWQMLQNHAVLHKEDQQLQPYKMQKTEDNASETDRKPLHPFVE